MKKYEVYLANLHGNLVKTGDLEPLGYCIKANIIFSNLISLDELGNINKSTYYYLISKEDFDKRIIDLLSGDE